MAEQGDRLDKQLEAMKQSFDLLFAKVESIGSTQKQMAAQLELTSQGVAASARPADEADRERHEFAQKLSATLCYY